MATIYPPYIDAKLPAQVGDYLYIPYRNNVAAPSPTPTLKAKVKTINTNKTLCEIAQYSRDGGVAKFKAQNYFKPGQYYKIQLRYETEPNEDNELYSTVGIFKYTTEPTLQVSISGNQITGTYQNADLTETVYSYSFTIKEGKEEIYNSGELIHDSSNDTTPGSSSDSVFYELLLEPSEYDVYYHVTTNNGLKISSEPLLYTVSEPTETSFRTLDHFYETGSTLIKHSSIKTGSLMRLKVNDNALKVLTENFTGTFTDYTGEHGAEYIYYIKDKNGNLYNSTNSVTCNFDSCFLFDGEKQLNLKFNTKISSFKNTIQEQKIETLGSKYPFVFRNGTIMYKEFSISSLISYWVDEEGTFSKSNENLFSAVDFPRTSTEAGEVSNNIEPSLSLTDKNFQLERKFKTEVLEWLNNGKPKLFRSPAEGNFLVRLVNVSLTPNDTLGRMLHTFNATAYEIGECSTENLKKYGILK